MSGKRGSEQPLVPALCVAQEKLQVQFSRHHCVNPFTNFRNMWEAHRVILSLTFFTTRTKGKEKVSRKRSTMEATPAASMSLVGGSSAGKECISVKSGMRWSGTWGLGRAETWPSGPFDSVEGARELSGPSKLPVQELGPQTRRIWLDCRVRERGSRVGCQRGGRRWSTAVGCLTVLADGLLLGALDLALLALPASEATACLWRARLGML
jgi:hypothetical protein